MAPFKDYLHSLGLGDDLAPRMQAAIKLFEEITGRKAEDVLLTPTRDAMGNLVFEALLFGEGALMNVGVLASGLSNRKLEVISLRGRVGGFRLSGKRLDPFAIPEGAIDAQASLQVEFQLTGDPKPHQVEVFGDNCRQLMRIVQRHLAANLA